MAVKSWKSWGLEELDLPVMRETTIDDGSEVWRSSTRYSCSSPLFPDRPMPSALDWNALDKGTQKLMADTYKKESITLPGAVAM